MVGNLSACQQTDFLVEVDLFKHLPESRLDSLVNDSRRLDCVAGHLIFSGWADRKFALCSRERQRPDLQDLRQ